MAPWQKSSFSGPGDGNECVELALEGSCLMLRESDEPDHILALSPRALASLVEKLQHS
ncbi:DUF397 domain-containing protein [Streptomyces sp. NPDC046465]|uniref:DUF397 domain-containing protein n=1 Tax=Streptomyces sp. NPDC046465 TaxID=3155810 RepID=UPI0033D96994